MTQPAPLDGQNLEAASSPPQDAFLLNQDHLLPENRAINEESLSCVATKNSPRNLLYNQHQNEETEIFSPGELLRKKRDQLGWGLDEAVRRTHLKLSFLKALEWDQYDQIPGETFVKGYLRTYGQSLELDVTQLLDAYETQNRRVISTRGDFESKIGAPEISKKWWQDEHLQRLGVGLMLVLVVLVLLIVWPYFDLSLGDRSKTNISGYPPASIAHAQQNAHVQQKEMSLETIEIDSIRGDAVSIEIIDNGKIIYRLSQSENQLGINRFSKKI